MVTRVLHPEMTEILEFLMEVTPLNIHLKASPSYGQRVNFESIWYRHGPMAARYFLLPDLYYRRLRRRDS